MALNRLNQALAIPEIFHLIVDQIAGHTRLVDFGIDATGGLHAGVILSEICMGGLGTVTLVPDPSNPAVLHRREAYQLAVQVTTDHPLLACMASQYAGWPISHGDYFAMGSGPMRVNRGREPVLEKYVDLKPEEAIIGVLESNSMPDPAVVEEIARECRLSVSPNELDGSIDHNSTQAAITLCIAPTQSMAGMIQIVARSIEATMHKLFELDFDLNLVRYAWGLSPLPPMGADHLTAIGRSNDSILYGGRTQLWLDVNNETIAELSSKIPSCSSNDYGHPFKQIFQENGRDFYAIDKLLFSAAQVTLTSTQTGYTKTAGQLNFELLNESFFG